MEDLMLLVIGRESDFYQKRVLYSGPRTRVLGIVGGQNFSDHSQ